MTNPGIKQFEDLLLKSGTFSEAEILLLSQYYRLVLKWNYRLHLTTVTDPAQFAERHIGEAEFAAGKIVDSIEEVWDLGTGLGIPGIPIAILRPALKLKLVESNRAKSIFLEETTAELKLDNTEVIHKRIEALADLPEVACVTVRAVEQMERVLVDLVKIGARCKQILVFGNRETESLMRRLEVERKVESSPIPGSDRRILIELIRFT